MRPLPDPQPARSALSDAETALVNQVKGFRLLAESLADTVVLNSPDLVREYVSPACLRLTGFEPEELIGRPVEEALHRDEATVEYLRSLRGVAAGETERGVAVYRLRHKTHHWVWVKETFQPMRDALGNIAAVVGTIRDVSERLLQIDELRIATRAAEQAFIEAKQASQSKSEFLAAMSHEIRTPLNAVIGFTNLILEGGRFEGEDRRRLELIKGAGHAVLTVVDDVLAFSKGEAGQVELDPRPFRLHGLLEETLAIAKGLAPDKKIAIGATLDPAAPDAVVGDPDRLRQVLLNFLNNAIKFTPSGSVTLRLDHEGLAPDGGERLRFSVIDTGIGVAPDKRARLFERFTQANGSIAREYGGTGLGLAIAKQLVNLMGGEIGCESVEHRGSTFWFTTVLPRHKQAAAVEAAAPEQARPAVTPARVLLVEDLDINQELIEAVLTREGFTVEIASNGAEAVRAVERGGFDVVLMDVQMPVMDGIAATQRIRCLPEPVGDIPIIALTATVLPDHIARYKAAGMNDHVGKPFGREELLGAIARWVDPPLLASAQAA